MSPKRLWRLLLCQPSLWVALVAWPGLVLLGFLARDALFGDGSAALNAVESALALSALALLGLVVVLGGRFCAALYAVRNHLFEGNYEAAYQIASRHPALGTGLGLATAIERLIEFDRRRAERVSAATRLLDRFLREVPVPMFLARLDKGEIRLSKALAGLFDVSDDTFSFDSLLLAPANEEFARLWRTVAEGERSRAEGLLTLRLPVRQATRRLHLHLVGVQDDHGQIAYVLGFARQAEEAPPPEP